jgi:hypothetical protein
MSLQIIKAKPNPAGKDRIGRTLTPQIQLAGEWVDIKNITMQTLNMSGVELYHLSYDSNTQKSEWQKAIGFSGSLKSGGIIRIHSGKEIPLNQMMPVDVTGADYHFFTDKNYIWNNTMPDKPSIWYASTKQWIDRTFYDAYPPDGKILVRVADKLV